MKTIYKYPLPEIINTVKLPIGYKILTAEKQGTKVFAWVLVDPSETEMVDVKFYVFYTGQSIPGNEIEDLDYINTIMFDNGMFVYHIFAEKTQFNNV